MFNSRIVMDEALTTEEKLEYFGGIPVLVDEPECLYDGTEAMVRLTELISSSKDYVFLATFLGSYCEELDDFYSAIAEKAESGVDVYMIIDGISSYDMTESRKHMSPLYFLKEKGVHLIEYAPLSLMRLINPHDLMVRDHRKLVVVDGRYAAIGGMNYNYISMGSGEKNQKDSFYIFESEALADAFMREFVSNWNSTSVEKIRVEDFEREYEDMTDGIPAYLFNQRNGGSVQASSLYATLINDAEESIVLLPYLPVMDGNMKEAIRRAIDRGVKVEMVFPIDSRGYAEAGVRYMLPDIYELGVDMYVAPVDEEHSMLHEKMMVVDGRWTVIGSTNFNFRSMTFAHEISLAIDSTSFAEKSLEHVEEVKKNYAFKMDHETALEWKEDGGSVFGYLAIYLGG